MNKAATLASALALSCLMLGGLPGVAQQTAKKPAAAATSEIVGMRRLTESEYRRSIADIFGPDIKIEGRFEPAVRRDGLIAIGNASASVSSSGMEQYYAIAQGISAQVTSEKGRKTYVPCSPKSAKAADEACATKFFGKYGRALYRRPLAAAELKALASTARNVSTTSKDFYLGLEETTTTMLTSPNFLFRIERGTASNATTASIDSYSRASRLSFLFWDTTPDEELLTAAEQGDLATPVGLSRQIDRLAASPRLNDGLSAFFQDMLQFDLFALQTKDPTAFPKYSQVVAEQSQQQTVKTIIDLLVKKNADYRDIFTSRDTFMTRTLAMVYKVPYNSKETWSPYTFSADSGRAGVLSQVSFLSLFAHPAQGSPTKRGVAINEIFLCQIIPPPPPDVDFSAVNADGPNKKKTVRLRLEAHRNNPTCSACHAVFDPLGLTLENFDALGQYRTMEEGVPIDVAAEYLGKKFQGAAGLGDVIHDHQRTPTCLARNLLATGTGRTPDSASVQALTKEFTDGGYRVPAFMKTLAKSDAFLSAPITKTKTAATESGK